MSSEPWSRTEADRIGDDSLALIAEVQGEWPKRWDEALQDHIWEDDKRAAHAYVAEDMAAYRAAHAAMRRKIWKCMQGGGR